MGQIWTRLFRHRDVRILLLGLDAAGKTTILYQLKLGDLVTVCPTIGFNIESFLHRDLNITAWDIGSRDKMRPLFRHYYKGTDAIVFVIDSSDADRIEELSYDVIKPALQSEDLANCVLLFLANKQDLEKKMSVVEITNKLGLKSLRHTWNIFPVTGLNGQGLSEALDWLAGQLGSVQAKKAVVAPVVQVTEDLQEDKMHHGMDYCTRAYSAIKCLFVRSNRQEP